MGTRADFYVGTGLTAEWLGSIAYDGYPGDKTNGVRVCVTQTAFRAAVAKLAAEDDFTSPEMGWPWPWENSQMTDYAYCFDTDHVAVFCFGRPCTEDEDSDLPKAPFPDMTERQKVTLGPRSGLIVIQRK